MNKRLYISLTFLFLVVVSNGCKDVEVEPRDWIKEDLVWDNQDKNATLAIFFLNDIYNYIPDGFNRIGSGTGDFLDAATDDAIPSRTNRPVEYYVNGLVSVQNNPDAYWSNSYAGIRRVNIFLANIDKVPTAATSITTWKAEARFIRALLYFELLKRYGGVPLVGDKIFTIEDDLALPRNTFSDCVNYIISECDAVKNNLKIEPVTDAEWGKVPKGAAIALKSRLLLYTASPLYNGSSNALTGYTNADPARWTAALNAANELIDLKYYALQTAYGGVFTVKKNAEIILAKQASNSTRIESLNAPVGYGSPAASQGLTSPTQNLVDAFPMANGLAITETGSGYVATNPYNARDPRLALTVFVNGQKWLSRNIETFDGGKDRPGGNLVQTRTGYYLRKFMADFSSNTTYTNQSHNFPIFRYAEIILNAAEALNELGRTEEAVTQVIAIRKRAGITAGTNSRYGIKAAITQIEMRTLIQNERRKSQKRCSSKANSMRRWKTAETVLSGNLSGMRITKKPDGTFTYSTENVSKMVFNKKLYYMPLPYDETIKNQNLIQNEGW